jgi:hypothetical protein
MKSQMTRFTRGEKWGGFGPSAGDVVTAAALSSESSEANANAPNPPPA